MGCDGGDIEPQPYLDDEVMRDRLPDHRSLPAKKPTTRHANAGSRHLGYGLYDQEWLLRGLVELIGIEPTGKSFSRSSASGRSFLFGAIPVSTAITALGRPDTGRKSATSSSSSAKTFSFFRTRSARFHRRAPSLSIGDDDSRPRFCRSERARPSRAVSSKREWLRWRRIAVAVEDGGVVLTRRAIADRDVSADDERQRGSSLAILGRPA